jgi:hypothetical protein
LRIVLAAHPDLSLTRRTYLWDRFFGRFGDLGDPRNLDRCLAAILDDARVRALEPDGVRIRRELADGRPTYARLFGAIHAHHAERNGKRRWGEQLKFVERFADPIFSSFPTARMIHLIRDPRSRIGGGTGARRPGAVGWETAAWLRSAQLAERNLRRYADRYLVLRYETFAADPERTIDIVARFVGEAVAPPMRHALATISFDQAGAGDEALGRAFIDRYAGRALVALGYPNVRTSLAPGERMAFELFDRPVNRLSMAAWRALRGSPIASVEA